MKKQTRLSDNVAQRLRETSIRLVSQKKYHETILILNIFVIFRTEKE